MLGLRKFLYCIFFGILELILVSIIIFSGKELKTNELILMICIIIAYPAHNFLAKIVSDYKGSKREK